MKARSTSPAYFVQGGRAQRFRYSCLSSKVWECSTCRKSRPQHDQILETVTKPPSSAATAPTFYCCSEDLHMAGVLVPDALWKLIEPLLPIPSSKPQGGRPRLTDRACLAGIIFVLRSGIPWRRLTGPTCLGTD